MLEPAFVVFGSGNVLWLEELEGVGVVEDREAKTGFVNLGGLRVAERAMWELSGQKMISRPQGLRIWE